MEEEMVPLHGIGKTAGVIGGKQVITDGVVGGLRAGVTGGQLGVTGGGATKRTSQSPKPKGGGGPSSN